MRGKRSPRGPWILAALALVLGVGLLSPAWAIEDPGDTGSEFVPPPKGNGPGSGGGGGGEADPDWWQTDGWGRSPVGALPAQDTDESGWVVVERRQAMWVVQGAIGALKIWLFQLSGYRLGS